MADQISGGQQQEQKDLEKSCWGLIVGQRLTSEKVETTSHDEPKLNYIPRFVYKDIDLHVCKNSFKSDYINLAYFKERVLKSLILTNFTLWDSTSCGL